jgi:transposase
LIPLYQYAITLGVEAKVIFKRQVFDIPEPRQMVTEHRVIVKECPECKTELKGSFPSSVKAPVQFSMAKE